MKDPAVLASFVTTYVVIALYVASLVRRDRNQGK